MDHVKLKHILKWRKPTSYRDLHPRLIRRLSVIIPQILELFPNIELLYLWGSFTTGMFVEDYTSTYMRDIVQRNADKRLSDIDLMSPDLDSSYYNILPDVDLVSGGPNSLFPTILIYKKYKQCHNNTHLEDGTTNQKIQDSWTQSAIS